MDFLLRSIVPYLAFGYITFVGITSKIRWIGLEHVEQLERRGANFIYAFWHNRQVLFTYTHRGAHFAVMVSKSKDGDIIAKVMALSRIGAVRGSSSRAALQATRELMDVVAQGIGPAFSPDGPKGPARKVKSGVIFLAQKTGLPIIPITNATSRKLVFRRSWDQFQVPLPFAKCCVVHGAPISVSPNDDLEAKARELEQSLDRITDEADRLVGGA